MSLVVEKIALAVSSRSRKKKFREFLEQFFPTATDTIIDVGVNDTEYSPVDNYLEKHYPYPQNITAVSQFKLVHFPTLYPQVTSIAADGLDLPFADRHFSIAYSNAVIEHVGGRDNQIQFLRELKRVGARGYVTTPSRHFPVELHTRVPLLHLLVSKAVFDRFLGLIGKEWAAGDYMNLLGKRELESIVAAAGIRNYTIATSRLCGFPLTYTLTW